MLSFKRGQITTSQILDRVILKKEFSIHIYYNLTFLVCVSPSFTFTRGGPNKVK